ncbi:hypothetical protein PGT21_036964 [Puccinia graminis f. sp. tritici]|uniref:Uncharacterized protein n=1 Tax=Puccinia graminis f. sp. tritici TaxID=56615 RepID=A0A5B0SA38_PUCGR|nr:hypothetical protein PGT21_030047 [Puccinia graminis f. sp. tritici]KAA1102119.1 hypothetical protein PGT21_036108 [Puccinia graminis f. sp. tritici]KAA1111164.1 hypothetical protein PGT21_036964 [Puccinia graminis f. sp. tritici]KAA1133983.1 hypothetical protein PGTUg99_034326 [Puccinia graminis f. sp. tritici]
MDHSRCPFKRLWPLSSPLIVFVSIPPKEVSKWVQAYRNGIATSIVVLFNVRSIGNLHQESIWIFQVKSNSWPRCFPPPPT